MLMWEQFFGKTIAFERKDDFGLDLLQNNWMNKKKVTGRAEKEKKSKL